MSTPPVVELHNVTFAYTPKAANVLSGVSFAISSGTVNVVLGPNGAGKSTLLHLILGRYTPQEGVVRVLGSPIREHGRAHLSRLISLVPQREYVPFDFTVFDYVILGRTPHLSYLQLPGPEDRHAAWQTLQRLGIEELWNRRVTEISGGELQLVLIARAVVQNTAVLLLDEPTAHLDPANKMRVLSILRALAHQGTTVLFTTHDPESAAMIADQVILLRQGRILRWGPLAEVFTTENLSRTYGIPLRVIRVGAHQVVIMDMDEPAQEHGTLTPESNL